MVSTDLHVDGGAAYALSDADGRDVPLFVEAGASEVLLDAELPPADVRPHILGMQSREYLGLVINDIRLQREGSILRAAVTLDRMPRGRLDLPRLRAEWLAQLDDPRLQSVAVKARTGVPARAVFRAPRLTGHGFTRFTLQQREPAPQAASHAADTGELENERLRIRVDPQGWLQITDKQTGLVLPRCIWFVDDGDRGDEYNFDALAGQAVTGPATPPVITVEAPNDVVTTVTVKQLYEIPRCLEADRETRSAERASVPITTIVRLYAGVPRVDFETTVDNLAADHRLRVHFQTPLVVRSAFMEQAFGTVERLLELEPASEFEQPTGTVPQKTFTCIQDGRCGVALFNRGIPEVEVRSFDGGTDIALTLIRAVGWLSRGDLRSRRGPAGPGLETPEAQALGTHRFTYALATFAGDWQTAGIVAQAYAFAFPPIAVMTDAHPGPLADDAALVQCDNPQVVLSALTAGKRPGTFITRWYNSSGQEQDAEITIPRATRVRAVDLLEKPTRTRARRLKGQRWRLQLRPFEIVTLQVMTSAGRA